jgi:hypothetical protein
MLTLGVCLFLWRWIGCGLFAAAKIIFKWVLICEILDCFACARNDGILNLEVLAVWELAEQILYSRL